MIINVPAKPASLDLLAQQLPDFVSRAHSGDSSALAELNKYLDDHPEMWQYLGDLSKCAEQTYLTHIAGNSLLMQECVSRKVQEVRQQYAQDASSPLETALADRIALCWLDAHHADLEAANSLSKELNPTKFRLLQHRQDRANRRYLAAIRQLAGVKRLIARTPSKSKLRPRKELPCND